MKITVYYKSAEQLDNLLALLPRIKKQSKPYETPKGWRVYIWLDD